MSKLQGSGFEMTKAFSEKLKYSPIIGTLLGGQRSNPEALDAQWWRDNFPNVPWVFNPYTGEKRDPATIVADQFGMLIAVAPVSHITKASDMQPRAVGIAPELGAPYGKSPLHELLPLAAERDAAMSSAVAPAKAMLLPADPKARKELVITTGVLDYFPLAIAEVARVSKAGNDQHHPGKPLHWDKTKSMDHADCIPRHLIDRGSRDTDGQRHSAKLAWRALALLQIELEREQQP